MPAQWPEPNAADGAVGGVDPLSGAVLGRGVVACGSGVLFDFAEALGVLPRLLFDVPELCCVIQWLYLLQMSPGRVLASPPSVAPPCLTLGRES